jgi:hypothetical protein
MEEILFGDVRLFSSGSFLKQRRVIFFDLGGTVIAVMC